MALLKSIRQNDGVITTYNKVTELRLVNKTCNSIIVDSYVDEEASKLLLTNEFADPYRKTITYSVAYDDTMTVADAYNYLKTLPEFEGAVDI